MMDGRLLSWQLRMGTLKLFDFWIFLVESGANKDQGMIDNGGTVL